MTVRIQYLKLCAALTTLALLGLPLVPSAWATATEVSLAGTWHGRLQQSLRLVLHFEQGADGGYSGSLDSPDQGAKGIPFGDISERGESLFVSVPSLQSKMVARRVSADSLAGEWRQGGMKLPLGLGRGAPEPPKRPQEPQGALPYDATDVAIETGTGGPRLAGTPYFSSP
jgi:hypothetical protein